jgi:hypothetical protein
MCDDIKSLTGNAGLENEIFNGYTCDLLSWVMAKGKEGTVWITVQNHLNVIAVASMIDFACVILPENISVEKSVLEKAAEENIPVLSSKLTAFELCIRLNGMGILG